MCAVFAGAGHTIIGVDLDQTKVDAINNHRAPVNETNLQELIDKIGKRISATMDIEYAVKNSDATFIVVATPSQENGTFSVKYVLLACEGIGKALKEKAEYHTVVVVSTVMPGHTAEITKELERISGKKAGVDFGVCYSPEFIALGSVIYNMQNPDMVLIGTDHPKSGDVLEEVYSSVVFSSPVVSRMLPVEAELAKISVNTFVTTKIVYANMLADLCEKLPGANVDVVAAAVGADSRIGRKYLKGGVSFGGPCFPRDNIALKALGESLGVDVALPREVHDSNVRRTAMLVERALGRALGRKVLIIGLTYKLDSEVIEESAGWQVLNELAGKYVRVSVYDPMFSGKLPHDVHRCIDLRNGVKETDLVLVMLPYPEVKTLETSAWIRTREQRKGYSSSDRVVVDCWRVLPHLANCFGVKYIPLGIGE
jgi:UDPglucose 6-dehydrogenase